MVKKVSFIVFAAGLAVVAYGCGAVKKEEPDVPTKYIKQADDAVDQYNEGVEQLNKTGDAVENTQE
jgi:hypothetical protein